MLLLLVSNLQRLKGGRQFIDSEAELSGEGGSSDEENGSGLDDMDSSFLDERLALTQAPGVDMTARYTYLYLYIRIS